MPKLSKRMPKLSKRMPKLSKRMPKLSKRMPKLSKRMPPSYCVVTRFIIFTKDLLLYRFGIICFFMSKRMPSQKRGGGRKKTRILEKYL